MKKLYRNQNSGMIAGVCSGLGNYLGIDSTIVRLVFVFLAFYHFLGVWVYLVMLIILPEAPSDYAENYSVIQPGESNQTTKVIGAGLIIIGILAVISTIETPWFSWMSLENLWPALIVLLGALLLARSFISEE